MMDTLRVYIERELNVDSNKNLEFYEENIDSDGVIRKVYIHKNIRVELYYSMTVISFSATKYALNNNYSNATRQEIRDAIQEVAELVGFHLFEASVSRIDIGVVVGMEHSTNLYLPYLHTPNARYKQVEYTSGVKFYNTSKSIILYDKYEEMMSKGQPDTNLIKGHNLIRYEIQVKHNCKDFLMKECKVDIDNGNTLDVILSDEYFDFYCSYLKNTYKSISTSESLILEEFPTKPKQFLEFGFALWLKSQDLLQLERSINSFYQNGKIKAHNRRNMIDLIQTLGVFEVYEYNLMSEMEEKIISEIEKY